MSDDDLEARVSELEAALRDLRSELERPPRPPRGSFGLPRPPTARELNEFTRDAVIPAAIAVLEAQVRALEAARAALRLTTPPEVSVDSDDAAARDESLGRGALDRIDRALADLDAELDAGRLPRNREARDLLEDARTLTDELRAEVAGAEESRRRIEVTGETDESGESGDLDELEDAAAARSVEDELDEIRRKQEDRRNQTGRKR